MDGHVIGFGGLLGSDKGILDGVEVFCDDTPEFMGMGVFGLDIVFKPCQDGGFVGDLLHFFRGWVESGESFLEWLAFIAQFLVFVDFSLTFQANFRVLTLQDVFKCPCQDTPYRIPLARAKEDYNDGAFWCSGTLNMLGVDQNPVVIFNPFSYKDLQDRLIGLDAYLECTSTGGNHP